MTSNLRNAADAKIAARESMSSEDFAQWLRSGPLRSLLDRVVRSAAELADVPYMVLGIRYANHYEFIATHGIPLTHYSEKVPASLLSPKLFAREVEVADLQGEAQFTALGIAPVAKTWRYGGNCPVQLYQPLSDGGVLALSCAHNIRCKTGGRKLDALRKHAGFISDLIWLGSQIARPSIVSNPGDVVASVLQAAVSKVRLPVAVIGRERQVLGRSENFASATQSLGGQPPYIGKPLAGAWLTEAVERAMAESMATGTPLRLLPITGPDKAQRWLDVFPFSFGDLGEFAIISLAAEQDIVGIAAPPVNARPVVAENGDGLGPVSRFLDTTLPQGRRLHHRGDTSYVSTRRWRASIRQHQIAALRALKSEVPPGFTAAVADELAAAVSKVYGTPDNCVIVPVPCGHSGPGCLSERLAAALGAKLGLPVIAAFAPMADCQGSSHPRKNARRKKMELVIPVDRPVILVDDVATSGKHIDEAASLLRKVAPSVWPVVWIAA